MSFALEGYIFAVVLAMSAFYFIAIPYYGTGTVSHEPETKPATKDAKKKKRTNAKEADDEVVTQAEDEPNPPSHAKELIRRSFFIWGFFITFWASIIFFILKTSYYLSETPYHAYVSLLHDTFNK